MIRTHLPQLHCLLGGLSDHTERTLELRLHVAIGSPTTTLLMANSRYVRGRPVSGSGSAASASSVRFCRIASISGCNPVF